MDKIKLDDGQYEDLTMDLLVKIENKFDFKFDDKELLEVKTFDDIISIIIHNLNPERDDTCTSQQAFYKIKRAVTDTGLLGTDKLFVPSTSLEDIFPKKNRRGNVRYFQNNLGFDVDMLEPNELIVLALIFLFFVSFLTIFFHPVLGFSGLLISIFSFRIIYRFSRNLKYKTIRELINSNLCENYISFRRDINTINETELRRVLFDWFSDNLGIDKSDMNRVSFQ